MFLCLASKKMKTLQFIILVCLVASCVAVKSFSDIWTPCSIRDSKCIADQWRVAMKHWASGNEELGLPSLDPLKVDNVVVEVPGLVYMHFDGFMRGMKGCIFEDAPNSIKRRHLSQAVDLRCNVTLKGHYNVTANTTVLFGPGNDDLLKADGIGKVKLDNLSFKFLMDFDIKRNKDGVIHFTMKDGPIGYRYKIEGPVQFDASKVFLGNEDITKSIVTFINQNWKFVMEVFGGFFFQKAMEIVSEFPRVVINSTPVNAFLIEDIGQYL